jgi:N-acetyl-gamma-glutamyl-phosphate reductase
LTATAIESKVQAQRASQARGHNVVRVALAGATGYAGRELIQILRRHPRARIARLMSSGRSTKEAFAIEHSHPSLRGPAGQGGMERHETWCTPLELDALAPPDVDLVFLATPHETSENCAATLLDRGLRVIDLSGAFRLKEASAYPRWYGLEHHAGKELAEAVYGLTELNAAAIREARLVANPGCYATSVVLALAPLVRHGWLDREAGVVCDSKSGVSGAGRAPSEKLHFPEVNENCRAYGLFTHRHVPEMLQALGLEEEGFTFTPHLLPITRGILSTIYVRLLRRADANEIASLYRDFYAHAPLVRVYPQGSLPEVQAVAHTNYTDLGFALDRAGRRLVVISTLDNLGKGAAGQAVENMNLMFGFPWETALA